MRLLGSVLEHCSVNARLQNRDMTRFFLVEIVSKLSPGRVNARKFDIASRSGGLIADDDGLNDGSGQ